MILTSRLHPVIPLRLRRPETFEAHVGTPQATTTVEPGLMGERNGQVDRDEPGHWLPFGTPSGRSARSNN